MKKGVAPMSIVILLRKTFRLLLNGVPIAASLASGWWILVSCGSAPQSERPLTALIITAANTELAKVTTTTPVLPNAIATEFQRPASEIAQAGYVPLFVNPADPSNLDSYLDLDTGSVAELESSDLKLSLSQNEAEDLILELLNGSLAAPIKMDVANKDGCITLIGAFPLADIITDLKVGDFYCVLTDQGRLSLVHIDKINHLGEGSLQLSFATWPETYPKP